MSATRPRWACWVGVVAACTLAWSAPTAAADEAATDPLESVHASPSPGLRAHEQGILRLDLQLHDVDTDRLRPLEKLTQRALDDVQRRLRTRLDGTLHVDFVGSPEVFAEVLARQGSGFVLEPWIAGLALLGRDRILVHVNGPGALMTSEVVRHELAHMAVHAMTGGRRVPRWYHEGVAMWLAGEASFERLRHQAGAAAFGQLADLDALDRGFFGNQLEVERAYAMAGGFVRFFSLRAGGDPSGLSRLHAQVAAGMPFDDAFSLTFGRSPRALFEIYASHVGNHASRWAVMMTDTAIWSVVSVLAFLALWLAWHNRPLRIADPEEPGPLDLEAIAAAGRAAIRRPWHTRDFQANPLRLDDTELALTSMQLGSLADADLLQGPATAHPETASPDAEPPSPASDPPPADTASLESAEQRRAIPS